jgi:hypothetical protein
MIEPGEVKKYYQWRSGFRSGKVECYLAETEDTIFFESGTSVLKSRLDEDLVQINEEIYFQNNSVAQAARTVEEKFQELMSEEGPRVSLSPPPPIQQKEKNPIQIILERQKKRETKNIYINIKIDVPNEKVIDLLTTMFDEDEVYEEIVSSSLNIDVESIKNLVKESIIKQLKGSSDE